MKRHGSLLNKLIGLGLLMGLGTIVFSQPVGATATQISIGGQPLRFVPSALYAHLDGNISAASCNLGPYYDNYTYLKTLTPEDTPTNNIVSSNHGSTTWSPVSCNESSIVAGTDGTTYVSEVRTISNHLEYRLAAYRNNAELWAIPLTACTATSPDYIAQGRAAHPTIGRDGTLYVMSLASSQCTSTDQDSRLYALSMLDGSVRANAQIAENTVYPSTSPLVITSGGVAILQNTIDYDSNNAPQTDHISVRYFNLNKTNTTYSFSENSPLNHDVSSQPYANRQGVAQITGDSTGQIYALLYPDTHPYNNCTSDYEIAVLRQTANGPDLSYLANDDCNFKLGSMAITPDGGLVTLGGPDNSSASSLDDRIIKFSATGSVVFDINLNSTLVSAGYEQPYSSSSPIVDTNGAIYIVSNAELTASWPRDRHNIVRRFEATTGASTVVYSSTEVSGLDGNTSERFVTTGRADIQNGTFYFVQCKSDYSNCNASQNISIIKATGVDIGNRYPQSEVLQAYTVDGDNDELSLSQEVMQGTLDDKPDTDRDGLTDYVESNAYPDRHATFCNTSATPISCATPHPNAKDIFVEIDWMTKVESNGQGYDYYPTQPSPSQLSLVGLAFHAKNIYTHFDIGPHTTTNITTPGVEIGDFGGGQNLPYIRDLYLESENDLDVDLYSYKNELTPVYFDKSNRYGKWRYMISGSYLEDDDDDNPSGIAYAGDDDAVIAYDLIKNDFFTQNVNWDNFDQQIAKLIMHELGHNLCLSPDSQQGQYAGQPLICASDKVHGYAGIYNTLGLNGYYPSVMGYAYLQDFYTVPSYSNGTHGNEDHDDWTPVQYGLDDFTCNTKGDEDNGPADCTANNVNQ
ncbi:hypothetical protein JNJ66_04465 [Candidatus Saccharibacteria bacterium]|nr:hypothetical protein [Candidatus Saccharibacteria bacterium]